MSTVFQRKEFSINNKRLSSKITEFVEGGFTSVEINWNSDIHRTSFIEVVEEWIEDELGNEITHCKVICDERNNPSTTFFKKNNINFEIQYKQKNCYNTSKILYIIERSKEDG